MSLHISTTSGGVSEMPPEGQYIARCFKIIDIGTQTVEWAGNTKFQKKVLIMWELLDDKVKMKDGKPFAVTTRYTASLDERGRLRPDLEAWRGRKFSDTELADFDLQKVLGAYCQLQIVHSEDGKYANVNSIMAFKGAKPKPVNPDVSFDIEHPDMEIFESFSDKLKEQIQAAPEFNYAKHLKEDNLEIPEKGDSKFPAVEPDEVITNFDPEEPINLSDIPF